MTDFGQKVKAAEREVRSKAKTPQNRTGEPKKKPPTKGSWKKGQSGNPETKWKPGVSPNPGGRPQKTPITDEFRRLLQTEHPKHKGKTYAQVLAEKQLELACETGDLGTAKEIADRVEGKVAQVQQHQGPNGGAIPFTNLSPAENEAAIAAMLAGAGDGDSAD
jgi:hypothetical protein